MYFFTDAQINKSGYASLETVLSRSLKSLTALDFLQELENGATILDTRAADSFSAGFIRNSINVGLDGMFAIWVGTLIPAATKLILVTEIGKEEESVLRLARVGYDNVVGYLEGGIETWKAAGETVEVIANVEPQDILDLPGQGYEILDVRRMGEFDGGHLEGAGHLCLSKIYEKAHTLDADKKYAIHCAGGYRSMIAASILHEKGIKNMVNVRGGFAKIKNVEGVKTVISYQ
jgi:rhodanese-related sulfurtransferase